MLSKFNTSNILSSIRSNLSISVKDKPIYLDYMSTTRTDPRVVDKMLPYFTEDFGNAHSRSHIMGHIAETATEHARAEVASLIKADPMDIIFTSGATESNNLAIKGAARYLKKTKGKNIILVGATEHKCVLEAAKSLAEEGFEHHIIPVDKTGTIDTEWLESFLQQNGDKVAIVSTMAVNNEIGTINPLTKIGSICHKHNVLFHTDAAQGYGKVDIDVKRDHIGLLSISAHKIYGPKGVGALYVSRRPRVRLVPLMSGGGQERGIRSGTLPVPLVVGMGEAASIMKKEGPSDIAKLTRQSKYFMDKVNSQLENVRLNGNPDARYPGCVNLSFDYVEGESLMLGMGDLCVSSGSACTSASLEPSYVLAACGVDPENAHTSIRFGIGRFTTDEELDEAANRVVENVKDLREMSCLYDMAKQGIDLNSIEWAEH